MDLKELRRQQLEQQLGIDRTKFGRIIAFIDFGNVNRWFNEVKEFDGAALSPNESVEISLEGLHDLLALIALDSRFYYGLDPANKGSLAFIKAAEHFFGKHRVFTKPIQQIRHDLTVEDSVSNTRIVHTDHRGQFVFIPKCNFDVEIAVDAIRLLKAYDTICLLSGDSDFVALLRHLRMQGKKVILMKGGRITSALGTLADLKIEAVQVKERIAYIKQRPGS